jgi:hypothetical protein
MKRYIIFLFNICFILLIKAEASLDAVNLVNQRVDSVEMKVEENSIKIEEVEETVEEHKEQLNELTDIVSENQVFIYFQNIIFKNDLKFTGFH